MECCTARRTGPRRVRSYLGRAQACHQEMLSFYNPQPSQSNMSAIHSLRICVAPSITCAQEHRSCVPVKARKAIPGRQQRPARGPEQLRASGAAQIAQYVLTDSGLFVGAFAAGDAPECSLGPAGCNITSNVAAYPSRQARLVLHNTDWYHLRHVTVPLLLQRRCLPSPYS